MLQALTSPLLRAGLTAMIAFRALRRNKMRSILTALGIIIGVASVVSIMALGRGTQRRIQDQVSSLGSNLLIVFSKSRRTNAAAAGSGQSSNLTLADVEAIRREAEYAKSNCRVVPRPRMKAMLLHALGVAGKNAQRRCQVSSSKWSRSPGGVARASYNNNRD